MRRISSMSSWHSAKEASGAISSAGKLFFPGFKRLWARTATGQSRCFHWSRGSGRGALYGSRGGPPRRRGDARVAVRVSPPGSPPPVSKGEPTGKMGPTCKKRSTADVSRFRDNTGGVWSRKGWRSRSPRPAHSKRAAAAPRSYRGHSKRESDLRSYVRCVRSPQLLQPSRAAGPRRCQKKSTLS